MPRNINQEPAAKPKIQLIGGTAGQIISDIPFFPSGEPTPAAIRGISSRVRSGEIQKFPILPGVQPPPAGGVPTPQKPPNFPKTNIGELFPRDFPTGVLTRSAIQRRKSIREGADDLFCNDLTGLDKLLCRAFSVALLFTRIPKLPVRFIPRTTPKFDPKRLPVKRTDTPKPLRPDVRPAPATRPTPKPMRRDKPFERPKRAIPPARPKILPKRLPIPTLPTPPDVGQPNLAPPGQPNFPLPADFPIEIPLPTVGEPPPAAGGETLPAAEILQKSKVSPATSRATGRSPGRGTLTGAGIKTALPSILGPFLGRSGIATLIGSVISPSIAATPATAPAAVSAPVSVAPFVTVGLANPAPTFANRPAARRGRECEEVKRKRKRGKCHEGFFEEFPGRTRFINWREVDCRTRRPVKDKF